MQDTGPRRTAAASPPAAPFFYGWIILLGGFLILVVDGGVRFSFGVLVKPLAAEFGWDRGAITFAYTLNMLVFGFAQMMAGRLLDRYGPQRLFSISALAASAGLFLTSRTNSIPELYFYYGVVTAIGVSGVTIGVVSSTVSRWFRSLRGLIGGIAVSGTAFGHFAVIPALAYSLERFGWRGSWAGLGVLVSAVVIPIALGLMKKEPAEMGLSPYEIGGKTAPARRTPPPPRTIRRGRPSSPGASSSSRSPIVSAASRTSSSSPSSSPSPPMPVSPASTPRTSRACPDCSPWQAFSPSRRSRRKRATAFPCPSCSSCASSASGCWSCHPRNRPSSRRACSWGSR